MKKTLIFTLILAGVIYAGSCRFVDKDKCIAGHTTIVRDERTECDCNESPDLHETVATIPTSQCSYCQEN